MNLFFQKYGTGQPLIVLHGLFGSSDNWLTLGKKLAEDFTVYLVDQRNHGRSPHSDEFSYSIMARDVKQLIDNEELKKATLIGHSMGGKTAMRFAQLYPEAVERLAVIDIGVKEYPPHHGVILKGLKAIDVPSLESRKDADTQMAQHISDFGTRQFLLKSLYRKDKDHFGWRINIDVLEEKMPEVLTAIPPEQVAAPALFVRGSKSDYVLPEDYPSILKIFPAAQFAELPTGHWVHAEDPDGLESLLKKFVTEREMPA